MLWDSILLSFSFHFEVLVLFYLSFPLFLEYFVFLYRHRDLWSLNWISFSITCDQCCSCGYRVRFHEAFSAIKDWLLERAALFSFFSIRFLSLRHCQWWLIFLVLLQIQHVSLWGSFRHFSCHLRIHLVKWLHYLLNPHSHLRSYCYLQVKPFFYWSHEAHSRSSFFDFYHF